MASFMAAKAALLNETVSCAAGVCAAGLTETTALLRTPTGLHSLGACQIGLRSFPEISICPLSIRAVWPRASISAADRGCGFVAAIRRSSTKSLMIRAFMRRAHAAREIMTQGHAALGLASHLNALAL